MKSLMRKWKEVENVKRNWGLWSGSEKKARFFQEGKKVNK